MPKFPRMLKGIRSIVPASRETTLFPIFSRHYSYQRPQPQMANIAGNTQDFFSYTSGRWVWNERQQLQERYREFDILELQKIAVESSSSGSCARSYGTPIFVLRTFSSTIVVISRASSTGKAQALVLCSSKAVILIFLDYNGDLVLELPENFKQLDEKTPNAVKDKVTNSILVYLYEKYTAERNPILSKVFQYPTGKTLTDPIHFVGNTWDGDILPLRESLIRIQKMSALAGSGISSAVRPSAPSPLPLEEIRQHYEDGEGWNEVQDFWDALSGIMSRDGWTSHETYDQATSIYSQIRPPIMMCRVGDVRLFCAETVSK
ncbi:uncharacterized protein BO80DRAFT_486328 [Aspergillus ibericus CBS 121593]|uniref:Uncharacterized protein n=1 Tax=Aspergillus ibericus CBS 121593 TaxID=1448316 RepID=A0A395H7Z2_9EURO|nr:hypothetical protein BO80DRAFT_486328 [Aspergillus ibericus CBS 121593]RAL04061.1 hypothetical protein BO80DRAFT_486328 [Aspergillus ibericus CBS 121593]